MLAVNVIRPAWRREFAITGVAEMGLLFAHLVSLITTVAVSAVVLSAIVSSRPQIHVTARSTPHGASLQA